MKTAIVYSCYLLHDWRNIVFLQIDRILQSDYYKENGHIYIVALGPKKNLIELKNYIKNKDRVQIKYYTNDFYGCEAYGFNLLYDLSLQGYKYIGFLHSKGISKPNMETVIQWRKCMEYFTIDNAHHLINTLHTSSYNCSGVLLDVLQSSDQPLDNLIITYKNYIFPGNFFWIKTSFFLEKNCPDMTSDRFYYERYLGTFENIRPYYVFIKKYNGFGDYLSYFESIDEDEYC
jgi:hypothetical protein